MLHIGLLSYYFLLSQGIVDLIVHKRELYFVTAS